MGVGGAAAQSSSGATRSTERGVGKNLILVIICVARRPHPMIYRAGHVMVASSVIVLVRKGEQRAYVVDVT